MQKPRAKSVNIDNEIHLSDFVRIRKNGQSIWFVCNNLGETNQFVSLWDFSPFHETAVDENRMDGLTDIALGLSGLDQCTMSVYSGANCSDRVAQLSEECADSSDEIKLLYLSEIRRVKELAAKRIRKNLRYQISYAYAVSPEDRDEVDGIKEKLLHWLNKQINPAKGGPELIDTLNNVFSAWEDINVKLHIKLKKSTTPVDGHRIWHDQWVKFNGDLPDPGLPYFVDCDLNANRIEVVSNYGVVNIDQLQSVWTSLLKSDSLPEATCDVLYLPNRKIYSAVLNFADIPLGWDEPINKYRFLWDSLLSVDGISDYELHSQLTWASDAAAFKTLQTVTKQNLKVHNTAQSRGNLDKAAELAARAGDEALEMLLTGDRPIFIGLAIVVYAETEELLKNSIRKIKNQFSSPCELYQEPNRGWKSWLQTTHYRMDAICTNRLGLVFNDHRHKPNISASVGLMPSTGIRNLCRDGVEFISTNGSVSVLVGFEDEQGSPWMGAIYGGTGSGKSVVSSRFIRTAIARGWVTTIIDLPEGKSNGSYSYLVKFFGGIEIDTGRSHNNLLEAIDLSNLDPKTARERQSDFFKAVNRSLVLLIVDTAEDRSGIPITAVKNILPRAIERFYSDDQISDRIKKALASHPGTPEWADWPTLHDFLERFDHSLNVDNDPSVAAAINFVRERLRYWLSHPISKAIASPSDHDLREHKLVLYSLRSISSNEEGAVLSMLAQQSAERRSARVSNSLLYIDECGVMLKYESIARAIGNDYLTARKKGKRVLIAMQTPAALDDCVAREDILENTSYKLIGKIKPEAIDSFERVLKMKPEDIAQNVGISANPQDRSTNWIVVIDGNVTHARYYADDIGLTAVLTNSGQVNLRNGYADRYPDKFEALARAAADVRDRAISGKDYKDWEVDGYVEAETDKRIRY